MAIADIFSKATPESGLSVRIDRQHKFVLTRRLNREGQHVYILENTAKQGKVAIARHLFDRFRALVCELIVEGSDAGEKVVIFRDVVHFTVQSDGAQLHIIQRVPCLGIIGQMTIGREALAGLRDLLFEKRLGHPNDGLAHVITYHKLFQFTFTEGSESITSQLGLRKGMLWDILPFSPSRGSRIENEAQRTGGADGADRELSSVEKKGKSDKENKIFNSRLAERAGEKRYQVDYEALFAGVDGAALAAEEESASTRKVKRSGLSYAVLPLHAGEIKSFRRLPFRCELGTEDMADLRERILSGADQDLYVGFEIMDAVFRSHGRLKAARFPLYYMRVQIKESNRQLFLEPAGDGRVFMNHLALANVVEQFSGDEDNEAVDRFFRTLLAQTIEIDKALTRVRLARHLPCADEVFDRTREVLLGYPSENGKGGILGNLKLIGIECDLETVHLYRASRSASLLARSLEEDLDRTQELALTKPDVFYSSLLGRFMTPEAAIGQPPMPFATTTYMPQALPKATRQLLGKLNRHDVVLLEGPPGTGKTHTIKNLLVHAVVSGRRLLVTSDQKTAIDALVEKVLGDLIDRRAEPGAAHQLALLWKAAVKVVGDLPSADSKPEETVRILRQALALSEMKELEWPGLVPEFDQTIASLDKRMAQVKLGIENVMAKRAGSKAARHLRVAPKWRHDSSTGDIEGLAAFVGMLRRDENGFCSLLRHFIRHRELLSAASMHGIFDAMALPTQQGSDAVKAFQSVRTLLEAVLTYLPKSQEEFVNLTREFPQTAFRAYLWKYWQRHFPLVAPWRQVVRRVGLWFRPHPMSSRVRTLLEIVKHQLQLFALADRLPDGVWEQLSQIHIALDPRGDGEVPLCLEIARHLMGPGLEEILPTSIQDLLDKLSKLQDERDQLVMKQFLGQLGRIATNAMTTHDKSGTSPLTRISALLDELEAKDGFEGAKAVWEELRKVLWQTFPLWIMRKQAVPLLLPCISGSFDLVIVDEATQCRVDDALPLLLRAKKLMVVGDDRQTVLAKNSVLDDYLFREFELDEHLRSAQAGAIKGGGSHLFGLVKAIKQAGVMLDEHYRCPPDIIQFSNRYVYHNELKIMQWTMTGSAPSVVVDHSEKNADDTGRRANGKFRGIESAMVDRFLEYVASEVKKIEKETGRTINMETDVALCYFLLKNEPYVKEVKAEFLRKLGRGQDVLDGAGAALQGKERDYMFFLWDVNRGNMMAFRQGDYEDKRKGELNVLMSRPKRRAYHYLHKNFEDLDHNSATITDYLWNALQGQGKKKESAKYTPRRARPSETVRPWTRGSGDVMATLFKSTHATDWEKRFNIQTSVVVGDPRRKIDLMMVPKEQKGQTASSVGVVDLAGFEAKAGVGEEIVDYYFQLGRAYPKIEPVFVFLHELADEGSTTSRKILAELKTPKKSA